MFKAKANCYFVFNIWKSIHLYSEPHYYSIIIKQFDIFDSMFMCHIQDYCSRSHNIIWMFFFLYFVLFWFVFLEIVYIGFIYREQRYSTQQSWCNHCIILLFYIFFLFFLLFFCLQKLKIDKWVTRNPLN